MATAELTVKQRAESGKGAARSLRREERIPAVVYGKELGNCAISLDPKELKKAIATEAGWNTLITLKGDGPFDGKQVILKDMQVEAIRRNPIHADFHAIDMKQDVTVMVPVSVVGKSEGEKLGGGLEIVRHELEVVCLPTNIPASFEIDVTEMNIGDVVHVEDIDVPEGVVIPHDVNFTVVTVVGRKAEEEEETGEGAEEGVVVEEEAAEGGEE
ncbi:MAG: 50S ribosomal protein L25 [Desulfuromonas sp.]|nr:MAG: 50S ribosomal protein L25 [Desulfuromonas sp.]